MIPESTALLGGSLGLGGAGVVLAAWAWAWRERRAEVTPAGLVPTGWRYCPECLRTRAAVQHADGSATCDCGTHIHATEEAP